jgi:hypothetical protein
MIFRHVFITWLGANLLHFFVWFFWSVIDSGFTDFFLHPEWYMLMMVFGAIISLPCLLIAWFFLGYVLSAPYTITVRFFLWMFIVVMIIVVAAIFVLLAYGVDFDALVFVLPAVIATVISIAIRYKQFRNLIDSTQPYEYETDLV